MSEYTVNKCVTSLITFGSRSTGTITPEMVVVEGLPSNFTLAVILTSGSLDLILTGPCVCPPTESPSAPTTEIGSDDDLICNQYKVFLPQGIVTSTTMHWTNGGGYDHEWINVRNLNRSILPSSGVGGNDRPNGDRRQ
jgi:hypothetical protein